MVKFSTMKKNMEKPRTVFKVLGYVKSIGVCGPIRNLSNFDSNLKKW